MLATRNDLPGGIIIPKFTKVMMFGFWGCNDTMIVIHEHALLYLRKPIVLALTCFDLLRCL